MGDFSKFLKEGTICLKSFPGAKAKRLYYCSNLVLSQHQYHAVVVHVRIDAKVKHELIQSLNRLLCKECIRYGFCFIKNEVALERKLWKGEIYLIQSGKITVVNNFIYYLNNFFMVNEPLNMGIVDKE